MVQGVGFSSPKTWFVTGEASKDSPGPAQTNTEETRTSTLAKQLATAWTEVEVPQDDASKKGATTTSPSSTHSRRGRPGLHLANQGGWRPRQCPQQGKSIVGLAKARQGFRPSLGCQSTTGQRKQGEGKAVENAAGRLGAGKKNRCKCRDPPQPRRRQQLPRDQTQSSEPPRHQTSDCNLKKDPNRQTAGPEKREEP
jgi:hypothetical protein